MQAHLDAYAAAAARRALDVVQVVGAAIVDGDRVLVAQRSGGPYDGCWEFPGGKVEPGESDLSALVREIGEELGVAIVPQAFLGEVLLDGVVGGGCAGGVDAAGVVGAASPARPARRARARAAALGRADELDGLDWIAGGPAPPARRPHPPRPPLNPLRVASPAQFDAVRCTDAAARGAASVVARESAAYLKASLTFSPACLRLLFVWSF